MALPQTPVRHLLPLIFLIFTTLPSTSAQDAEIECLVPARMGTGPRPVYKTGETVQFQWKSTFPLFDLTITQVNSNTGAKTNDKKFDNEPNSTTDFFWTAHNFDGLGQNDPMHLWITAGEVSECDKCHCRSANFTVLDAETPSPTTISSAIRTATDTPSASLSPQGDGDGGNLKLSLGLGLGLGIPLLVILTALTTWLCARRRRRQQRQSQLCAQRKAEDRGGHHRHYGEGVPLDPAVAGVTGWRPPSAGYASSEEQEKSSPERGWEEPEPGVEMADSRPLVEMLTDNSNTRAEAPAEGVRAELEGDEMAAGRDEKRRDGWM